MGCTSLVRAVTSLSILVLVAGNALAAPIGIHFVGKGEVSGLVYSQPMTSSASAGVPPHEQAHWNNAEGSINSSGLDLVDGDGQPTGASLTWTYAGKGNTWIDDNPGNNRMMRGYIYKFSTDPAVTVSGLGPAFTSPGYDVLVYFDGDNGGTDWTTDYTISVSGTVTTLSGTDSADTDFAGTFDDATTDGIGNYVRFTGLTSSDFTLTATVQTGEGPINGLQIAPEPSALALLTLALAATFARRRRKPGCRPSRSAEGSGPRSQA